MVSRSIYRQLYTLLSKKSDSYGMGQVGVENEDLTTGDRLDGVDYLACSLATIQKRWEDRFGSKNFGSIGENYTSGRLSLILEFESIAVHRDETDSLENPVVSDSHSHVRDTTLVHLVNQTNSCDLGEGNVRDEEIVFVDVVGLSDLPKKRISSFIGLYSSQKMVNYSGQSFNYSSVGWRFFSRFGLHEGLTKSLPAFIDWEAYARRITSLGIHQASGDIVERRAKAVESIPYRQNEIRVDGGCFNANDLFAGIRVSIVENVIKIGFDVCRKPLLRLINVSVGPIDL